MLGLPDMLLQLQAHLQLVICSTSLPIFLPLFSVGDWDYLYLSSLPCLDDFLQAHLRTRALGMTGPSSSVEHRPLQSPLLTASAVQARPRTKVRGSAAAAAAAAAAMRAKHSSDTVAGCISSWTSMQQHRGQPHPATAAAAAMILAAFASAGWWYCHAASCSINLSVVCWHSCRGKHNNYLPALPC
jgi:hypothetical protein